MKDRDPVALQSSHLVEGSCSAGRDRGRRFFDVVECADHVDDCSERVIRLVFGGNERFCAVVVEVSWCGRPGVSQVSRRRGLRFGRTGRSLLRLVVAVWRFWESGGAALAVSRESILSSARSLAWWRARGVRLLRVGLSV